MGKSMGAIPGATPSWPEKAENRGMRLSWCSCGTGFSNDRNNKRGMTQTFVAFALANGNSSHFLLTVSILEVLQDVSSPLAKLLLLGQLVLVSWMAQAAPR